jgi:4-hydroxy-tetrahydrodipicolinate reductase
VFQSGSMSLGILLLKQLARQAAQALGESFDVEIIEAHHNQKIDAPSGTALILAGAVNEGLDAPRDYTYERQSRREPRGKNEIGIHSVRGGTQPGEHTVLFAGFDEVVELTHRAYSKRIFAAGCLAAARWLPGKPAGRYGMDDMQC